MQRICEKYSCLPSDVEDLSLDQIHLLVLSEKQLERLSTKRQTTISELQQEGVIPFTGGGSYVQRLKAMRQAQREAEARAGKRERRRQRREDLIRYKRERGEL